MIGKKFFKREFYENIFPLVLVVALFVLASYLTQKNVDTIRDLILEGGILSVLAYMLVTVVAIVAAPLTSIPLIPLVVQAWGVFLTGVFSIIGWTIGSMMAFWVARKFGESVVSKIESLERLRSIGSGVSDKKIFWYLIFLRMTIPVDILSYALGVFTKISWKMFFVTTFLGVIPITFIFAYVGSLPVELQVPFIAIGIVVIIFFFSFHSKKIRKR